jgi:hypothetical protein
MLLKIGDTGGNVKLLKHRLNNLGYPVDNTPEFNSATLAAVIQLQTDKSLVIDGIAGDKTMAALLKRDTQHFLSQRDLHSAADLLNVDLASIFAIKDVESRGNGYLPDGRVVILYERHIMRKRLKANGFNAAAITQLQGRYPNLVNNTTGGYRGMSAEHYRLSLACDIDITSAYESCSWGLFQIMGYHWKTVGYNSPDDFIRAMRENEGNQLHAFCQFIKADRKLHTALQAQDWAAFARIYNGPNYKKNQYDKRLQTAYENYQDSEVAPWD